MKIQRPNLLREGDTVALLCPSSPLVDQSQLPAIIRATESLGVRVKAFPTTALRDDYQAGSVKQRAADLTRAFLDPKIDGILCVRGGYSAGHMIPVIDWKKLGATKKFFSGISDLTTVMVPLMTDGNLISLHGPWMGFFLKTDPPSMRSHAALRQFMYQGWRGVSYRELCGADFVPETIVRGTARGRIIGGNLSVFTAMIGTPAIPRRGNYILFIEDVGEKAYRVDRYITQLIQSGFMNNVRGIVLGQFTDCPPATNDRDDAMTVLRRMLKPLKIPTIAGLPVGHDRPSYPLPIGEEAELNANRGDLVLL
ncbi:LD-carboxypeptidase [soil metagenome]